MVRILILKTKNETTFKHFENIVSLIFVHNC